MDEMSDPLLEPSPPRRRSGLDARQRMLACVALGLAALTVGGVLTAAVVSWERGFELGPGGRKGAAVALVAEGTTLLAWSGRGKHAVADLDATIVHALNVETGKWRALWPRAGAATPVPPARWKSVCARTDGGDGGLLVFGGDAQLPSGQDVYLDDLWRLQLREAGGAAWQNADARDAPLPRRAAAGAVVADSLIIHGGRQRKKKNGLLNDVWSVKLGQEDGQRWRKLWPRNDDATITTTTAPAPRKGHAAVGLPSGALAHDVGPSLWVYGGRNDSEGGPCYHRDVSVFDVEARAWIPLHAGNGKNNATSPPPRDHGGAFYAAERKAVYVFGGRGGETYETSKPLADVWRFDLHSRRWHAIERTASTWPAPRFLFGLDAVRGGDGVTRVVVFGGEGLYGAYLDDAWEFNVGNESWRPVTRGAVEAG